MLITKNLSIKFSGSYLLRDINISLDSKAGKKVALVGRNGGGKSTLLKLLDRQIAPSEGSIDAAGEQIAYLPQEIEIPDYELVGEYLEAKLAEPWQSYLVEIAINRVGLGEDYLIRRIAELSGGERVRVALAGLLMDEPTVLLLDEPTNNLDTAGVAWLEGFIAGFAGSIIVVSHDRRLINNTVKVVWEIDPDSLGIAVYSGNYDEFLVEKNRRYEKRLVEYNMEEREIREIEKWLKANEFHPKYRFSRIVASQKGKLARLKTRSQPKPVGNLKLKMRDLEKKKRGLVLAVDIAAKKFNGQEVISGLAFKIHQHERVLLAGPNGSGKTTLLRIITGEDADFRGTITFGENVRPGYLPQFSTLDGKQSVLGEFEKRTGLIEPRSRSVLASYAFGADMVRRKVAALSYGQQRRLELAIVLAQEPNLLILDEPTNHLDIYTREELESFITAQAIPMIIVSHDRYFVDKIAVNKVIELGRPAPKAAADKPG